MSEENTAPAESAVETNEQATETATESLNSLPEQNQENVNTQDVEFSRKFAALTRKEKEHREAVKAWETEKADMAAKLQQYEDAERAQAQTKEELPLNIRLQRDPLGTLAEMGIGYDELTELAINDGKLTPEMQMKVLKDDITRSYEQQIKNLEERLNERDKQEEEAKYNTVVDNFKQEITEFIDTNSQEFSIIKSTGNEDLVYDVISEYYESEGKILDIADAAKEVEAHLNAQAEKILQIEKFASQLKGAQEPQKNEVQSPTTLSNDHSTTSSNVVENKLSNEESKAQAAKLIKWENN